MRSGSIRVGSSRESAESDRRSALDVPRKPDTGGGVFRVSHRAATPLPGKKPADFSWPHISRDQTRAFC